MFQKTDIEKQLFKKSRRKTTSEDILKEVRQILSENENQRLAIRSKLDISVTQEYSKLNLDLLDSDRIYHLNDIKQICIDYRLRFLDSKFFKGPIPEEAVSEIRRIEAQHYMSLNKFKIIAPAKLLKLENADDPLLFTSLGNDYYYLIHKWGNDLHPLRKALMWPYKTFENLIFAVFVISVLLTSITPMQVFTRGDVSNQEYLLMFLFMFKAVGGIVLFYGFAKGKNFNTAIWDSKYYNA